MHPLYVALPGPHMQYGLHAVLWPHIGTPPAPPSCRTSQYRGTFILLLVSLWHDRGDHNLMVWDWCLLRAGAMPVYWLSCSLPFCLLLFSLSLLSFYGLVLWGWGLRTDRGLIALSQPCSAYLFNNNKNILFSSTFFLEYYKLVL